MCIFKSLTGYTDNGGYENWNAYVVMIIKTKVKRAYAGYFKLYFVA